MRTSKPICVKKLPEEGYTNKSGVDFQTTCWKYFHNELTECRLQLWSLLLGRLGANVDRLLLPVLQLRTILEEPTLGEMEDALGRISHDPAAAFEETILQIRNLLASRSRLGMGALMWISSRKTALTIPELMDALAIRQNLTNLRAKYRPSPSVILECCQGLVMTDPESNVIRPAHYTIQEYLVSHTSTLFPRAAAEMASACLKYLSLEGFLTGP